MVEASSGAAARLLPHLILPGFLGEDRAEAVLRAFLADEATHRPAAVGTGDISRVAPEVRDALDVSLPKDLRKMLEDAALAALPSICDGLSVPRFTAAVVEVQGVGYGHGGHYRRHSDTVTGPRAGETARAITLVYYVFRRPRAFTGGALRLHALAGDLHQDIEPVFDQGVAFPSWAPHQVMPVSCPDNHPANWRFAVNVWIRKPIGGGRRTDD